MTAAARPYEDLLATLAAEGLAIGASEHLVVAQLAKALAGSDRETERAALAAILARDETGVRQVKEAFDRLYLPAPTPLAPERAVPPRTARWTWSAIAVLPLVALLLWMAVVERRSKPTPPASLPPPAPAAPADPGLSTPDRPPPRIEAEPVRRRSVWILAVILGAAVLALLPLLIRRLRRHAAEDALERELLDRPALPGPFAYELLPRPPRGYWESGLLDDVAFALGRRVDAQWTAETIDVERTVERSLRTMPLPELVFLPRRSPPPLLVLEDLGEETRRWRPWVDGLLDGLAARGVAMDRWRFHGDGSRVFRAVGAPARSLQELHRRRADSPLLVISAGEGVPERATLGARGIAGRRPSTAAWTAELARWTDRAWLHPVPDRGYWRPPLASWPEVLPLNAAGLAAAVERLVPGRGLRSPRRGEPRTHPRDLQVLRWLLSLSPQANTEVAEMLRHRFLSAAPRSILLEALEGPPLSRRPPGAPDDDSVRELLSTLLAETPPPPGSEAHERWQLDQALLAAQIADEGRWRPAVERLRMLADGPLGGETRRAVARLAKRSTARDQLPGPPAPLEPRVAKLLRREVLEGTLLHALGAAPTRRSWRRSFRAPSWREALAWAALTTVTAGAVIWTAEGLARPTTIVRDLRLTLGDGDRGTGDGRLEFLAPATATEPMLVVIDSGKMLEAFRGSGTGGSSVSFGGDDRDTWAYARAKDERDAGTLHVSDAPLWIPRRVFDAPPPLEPMTEATPTTAGTPTMGDNQAAPVLTALAKRRQRANELVQRSLREIAGNDLVRARATLVQALALAPDDPFGLFNLGLVEMKTGHRDEAVARFERLLALEAARPGSVPAELRSPALATLGLLYYEKDSLEYSRRYLEQATALDPSSSRNWNNLGLTLGKSGDPAGAERAYRKGLEIAPDNVQLANNLAQLLMNAQRWTDAATLLTPVTAGPKADALAWLNLGLAQRGAGDRTAAGTSLQRVLALDAHNKLGLGARAALYLALVRFDQGDGAGAVTAARQAIGWRPDDVDAWTYLGLAQKLQEDLPGARNSLQRAATLDAKRPEVHNNLGTVLFALKDLPGAEAELRQALALRPGFAEAQSNLDQVLVAQLAAKVGTSSTTSSTPASARPRRQPKPFGVRLSDADFTYLGIKGAMVESVSGDSPAEKAGIRKGDVVLGVDGEPIEGPQQLLRYLGNLTGERDYVEMDILREGQPRRLRVDMF